MDDEENPVTGEPVNQKAKSAKSKKVKVITEDEFRDICAMVSQGLSANAACKELGLDNRAFWNYLSTTHEDDLLVYSRAIRTRSLSFADRIDDVVQHVQAMAQGVHTGNVEPSAAQAVFNAGRLAVDAYRWTAARLMPQLYGETQNVNMSVSTHTQHMQALKDMAERGRQKLIARGVEPEIEVKAIPVMHEGIPSTKPTTVDPKVEPAMPYQHPRDDDPAKLPPMVIKQRFVGEVIHDNAELNRAVAERVASKKE
jgi:hypothetical protein